MSDRTPAERAKIDSELIEAAFVCDLVRVRALLAQGGDPNARDDDGRTPIFSAVLGNSVALLGLLVEARGDVNAHDDEGWTALHFAAQENLPEIAQILIGCGADVNARDGEGRSVLSRAIFSARGRDGVVRLLRSAGARDEAPRDEAGPSRN
jgi:ankyrin repeat protein